MPHYGWIVIGIGAWCLVSVPVGLSAGRLVKRMNDPPPEKPAEHLRATTRAPAGDHRDVVRRDNERLLAAARDANTGDEARFVFLCECRDELCREYVRLTLAQHDTERAARGLILYPGHIPVEDEPIAAEAEPTGEPLPGAGKRAAPSSTEAVARARTRGEAGPPR